MAAYYSGPRVRLPSNRSLETSDVSSGPSSPHLPARPHSPTNAPILIFPAPSSAPASPHPHRSRSSSAHPLRLRHTRVDSNASSLPRVDSVASSRAGVGSTTSSRARVDSTSSAMSLVVSPSATDVSSPRFSVVNSPRVRSATTSEWDDLGAGSVSGIVSVSRVSSGSALALSPTGSSPLTRDRIVRLGSARMIPSSGRSGSSVQVEMWEWTSTGSADEGWIADETETHYEDALSQFHFPTLEESRWARTRCEGPQVGAVSVPVCVCPAHPALGKRAMRLPFRFLLEKVLGIDRKILMLLERGTHASEAISETGLFGMAITMSGETEEEVIEERGLLDLGRELGLGGARMVKRGLDALAEPGGAGLHSVPLPLIPLQVSICLVASIPRRVWAAVRVPKWCVGDSV